MVSRLLKRHHQRHIFSESAPQPNTPAAHGEPHQPLPTVNRRPVAGMFEVQLSRATQAALDVVDPRFRFDADVFLTLLLRHCAMVGLPLSSHVAYVLATVEHETAFGGPRHTQSVSLIEDHSPLREDKTTGRWHCTNHITGQRQSADTAEQLLIDYWNAAYGDRIELGNRPGSNDGYVYRGRGFTPLVGRAQYARVTEALAAHDFSYELDSQVWGGDPTRPIDLVARPDHLRRSSALAARVAVLALRDGLLTGVRLDRYLTPNTADFINARRCVRGTDQAVLVASIARRYHEALTSWSAVLAAIEGRPA